MALQSMQMSASRIRKKAHHQFGLSCGQSKSSEKKLHLVKMSYVLKSVLFVIISYEFVRTHELRTDLSCPPVTNCECSISTYYEIACPNRINATVTLRVEPQRLTSRVEIDCNSSENGVYHLLPAWNIGAADVVKLNNCPTATSLQSVFNQLGIRDVRSLIFYAKSTSDSTILPQLFDKIENITSLDLRAHQIHLSASVFKNLHELQLLQIMSTDVKNVDGIFHNLHALKRLHLLDNDLRDMSKVFFAGAETVTDLVISSNVISAWTSNVFERLTALQSINLSRNQLPRVPSALFQRNKKTLQSIQMVDNQFESNAMPNELFAHLPNLQTVSLNSCRNCSLSSDIFRQSYNIANISLARNGMDHLPRGLFQHQSQLINLDLSFNDFAALDADLLQNATNIVVLRLSHNQLTMVPE